MSIKATFLTGVNHVSVSGLYQWDYGQILEIESVDIGNEIAEVHFACPGMSEAVVRSCSFAGGVGSVTIPDTCLEQPSTITAWVYRINGTQGYTWKTISLPVTARTRPAIGRDIPQEISDKYTELLTEVNETIDGLESGNVIVARAQSATSADHAATAGNAETAGYAVSTGFVETANLATKATQDSDGNVIKDTYAKKGDLTGGSITVAKAEHAVNADYTINAQDAEYAVRANIANTAGSATKATQDSDGYVIKDTYAKKDDITGGSIAVAKADFATNAGGINTLTNKIYSSDGYPEVTLEDGIYLVYSSVYVSPSIIIVGAKELGLKNIHDTPYYKDWASGDYYKITYRPNPDPAQLYIIRRDEETGTEYSGTNDTIYFTKIGNVIADQTV